MSMVERVESLKVKHRTLETLLRHETQRPLPDPAIVTRLKREKLRIKDEIARIAPA
ncbi:YdcH family protein [Rhodocista pekingensis]|uniref:YdcH family protein n=1 Tax=Rhodocista pekingensis TaxID=201185 RepID=A0ABW2KWE9_9PROT